MILRNFCVFEGIDGTGTTTQIHELETRCRNASIPAWFTCEPTDGEIGRLIRRALSGTPPLAPDTMARLFAADRGEHLEGTDGIRSRLEAGSLVVSDRYLFSSIAYQGIAGDSDLPFRLNADYPLPELLFFFDLDHDAAMDRVERRAGTLEIYEKRDFQRLVRERYRQIIPGFAAREPGMKVVHVEASLPVADIAEIVWREVQNLPIFKP